MSRHAVGWMAEHRDRPFFFFLHSFEAHSDFHALPYEGPGVTRRVVEQRFGVPGYGCREEQCASGLLSELSAGRIRPLANEEAILRFLYGEGVRHLDAELGRLFADLEELGLFDRLLIVLTSDHGEAFFEHGHLLHGDAWNEVLRVSAAGQVAGDGAPARWRRRHLGARRGAHPARRRGPADERAPGRDLGRPLHGEPVFSWDPGATVVAGDLKAIFRLPDGRPRLYDLAADPREQRDLAAERPAELARLERLLAAREAADRASPLAWRRSRAPGPGDAQRGGRGPPARPGVPGRPGRGEGPGPE